MKADVEGINVNDLYYSSIWKETGLSLVVGYLGGGLGYVWYYLTLPYIFDKVNFLSNWGSPIMKAMLNEVLYMIIILTKSKQPIEDVINHFSVNKGFGVAYICASILVFRYIPIFI